MRKMCFIIILVLIIFISIYSGTYVYAMDGVGIEIDDNLNNILNNLDLRKLDEYLKQLSMNNEWKYENSAVELLKYLISGNLEVRYSSYINEILAMLFEKFVVILPTIVEIAGLCILCAIVKASESNIISKDVSNIVGICCKCVIIVLLISIINNVIFLCTEYVESIKTQLDIISPLLLTTSVLTGANKTINVLQPSALFLSVGMTGFIENVIIFLVLCVIIIDALSAISENFNFEGFSKLLKSVMKWSIGLIITIYSIFIGSQAMVTSTYDGVIFKATKYIVGNGVPIVGNFISGGLDLLTATGLMVKNSVGLCGILLLISQIFQPITSLFTLIFTLKLLAGIFQPICSKSMYKLFVSLSSNLEYLLAGILTISFMYFIMITFCFSGAVAFI